MKSHFYISVFTVFVASIFSRSSFATDKKTKLILVMVQILCQYGDRSGNFVRIENAIREAKWKNADIIVFPESCFLGWENQEAYTLAFPIPRERNPRWLCRGVSEQLKCL
jgi:predicted amidohydrolase